MPLNGAERQAAYRTRLSGRVAALEAELPGLRRRLAAAETQRDDAQAECERLQAQRDTEPDPRCERCQRQLKCPACYYDD